MTTPPGAEIILAGTIESIEPISIPRSKLRWKVTVQVDRIVTGQFAGPTFEFAIHSPHKAGLTVGGKYTVRATRNSDGGLSVDERQWNAEQP